MIRYELKWVDHPMLGRVTRWQRIDPHQRLSEIGEAYDHCMNHDAWPEGFLPFDAIGWLLSEVRAYRRSLVAHHDIATLSDAAVSESLGGPCRICARAQVGGDAGHQAALKALGVCGVCHGEIVGGNCPCGNVTSTRIADVLSDSSQDASARPKGRAS